MKQFVTYLRCLLLVCLGCWQWSAEAQQRDSTYYQLMVGINKSANENLPWSEFSRYPWAGGIFAAVGEEWNPWWGWRLSFGFDRNKSRSVPYCESADIWKWSDVELFYDVTFDLGDCLSKLRGKESEQRAWGLKAFAGLGGMWTFDYPRDIRLSYEHDYSPENKLVGTLRAGLTATYRFDPEWCAVVELSHTLAQDKFNGVVDHKAPLDMRSNLSVGVAYTLPNRVRREVGPIVYSNRLKMVPVLPMQLPEPEGVKKRQIVGRAFLDFPVNETIIYPTYRNNPNELQKIAASIDSAQFDQTVQITSISLHGYASPEGPYANNIRLAKGRTEALASYLKEEFHLDQTSFETNFTPEDWMNLRSFVQQANRRKVKADIWYDNEAFTETPDMPASVLKYQAELLDVIDSNREPDEKNDALKRVGGGEPYRWLLAHVYPGLRHTDYIIEYVVREYPTKDARRLIYTHPEALSVEEMYRVALSYSEEEDGYYEALTIAANQYPQDPVANLNAACACVKVHRLRDAKEYLKKAGDTEEARYVQNVILAMEGKRPWKEVAGKIIFSE